MPLIPEEFFSAKFSIFFRRLLYNFLKKLHDSHIFKNQQEEKSRFNLTCFLDKLMSQAIKLFIQTKRVGISFDFKKTEPLKLFTMQYFHHDKNLHFLKEKITEIKTAFFRTELNPELQLPNNIIQTLKVEADGTVWFFTSCNGMHINNINPCFYAYLSYQRKGSGVRLHLSGKATIIGTGDEGLFSICNYAKGSYGKLVLVKMKIMHAEFFENTVLENTTWTEKLIHNLSQFFMRASHRVYNFSE